MRSTPDPSAVETPITDRMDNKCVVITGATSGIGRVAALALGRLGADIVLLSRDRATGTALADRLRKLSGATAEYIETDLSSFAQVRTAAAKIRERWSAVDVLLNNAGARFDTYGSTPDHCERTFATNHLGHFLLTGLLLDRLASSPAARIITISSSAAAQALNDGFWQYGPAHYDRRQAYAKSKLANLLFATELAHRLKGTSIFSLSADPGIVATRFARNNGLLPWIKHLLYHGRRGELILPAQGADTLIYLAAAAALPAHAAGGYFHLRRPVRACPAAYDQELALTLWKTSVALTGIDPLPKNEASAGSN